jgi:hypothetical protein
VHEQVGAALDPGADVTEAAVPVTHGDHEPRVDEQHHLADLDHLLRVHVGRRLDDDEQRLVVELDLGPLMGLDRVLDGELVEVELAGDRLELLGRGLVDTEPDEAVAGVAAGRRRPGLAELEVVGPALAPLVDGAVDDHGVSMAAAPVIAMWAGSRRPPGREAGTPPRARSAPHRGGRH